ncbi:MAG: NCS2 family permease [Candidatus Omnitrophica bacterium]|nr:NCS2 family permease [Candidatus Omnitrophota bacterium]MCM8792887.1 NCS2 family permease [Candidatus Omnitrophota bacterium]
MGKMSDFFNLTSLETNWRTEILAGLTTFMTMAYIIFVNPAILSTAGMDFGAVMVATCLATAISTILMGIFTNYPIALAPGMGMNAYFAYTVCIGMGIPWQVALGCIFIEGVIFIFLTLSRIRQMIFDAIPQTLRIAVACGIGLLIAFVGLKETGLIVAHPATLVTLGKITTPYTLLSLLGLLITSLFLIKKIKGGIFLGIIITAILGIPLGIVKYRGLISLPPSIYPTLLKLDIFGAFKLGFLTIIFTFLFMDVFDTVGTLAGVGEIGGFIREGKLPRAGRCLFVDALGTVLGSLLGVSTVTSYIESISGISEGGRSGLTSVVVGLLFLISLFFYPFTRMIGGGYEVIPGVVLHPVTAPALIIVGALMFLSITKIDWRDYAEAVPAFLVIIIMPLTFSIANGLAIGFVSYTVIKLLSGRGREVSLLVYLLSIFFILKFAFIK